MIHFYLCKNLSIKSHLRINGALEFLEVLIRIIQKKKDRKKMKFFVALVILSAICGLAIAGGLCPTGLYTNAQCCSSSKFCSPFQIESEISLTQIHRLQQWNNWYFNKLKKIQWFHNFLFLVLFSLDYNNDFPWS